jgi:hypothetical protein
VTGENFEIHGDSTVHSARQNAWLADSPPLAPSRRLPRGRPRFGGEATWGLIALAYAGYWAVFVAGAYTNMPALNNLGAVFILAALAWAALDKLWVRLDGIAIACLAAMTVPLVAMLAGLVPTYPDSAIKHISLYAVIALSRLLRLPVASTSGIRVVLAAQVLAILVLSAITDRSGVWDGGTRHSGLFANPNNLALIPFLLLLFVDRRRDSAWIQMGSHAVVVAVLVLSGTSGALIAYAIGLAFNYGSLLDGHWRQIAITFVAAGALLTWFLVIFGGEQIIPETRITNQVAVMGKELDTVLAGNQVAYYSQERILGPGAASGIWRLEHWRDTLFMYADGTVPQQLLGFGIGSSPVLVGKLPHNEYLRILFEQGAVGFGLFLFIWTRLIRGAPPDVRYCGLILAIYSFSENNLDNFPFMSLFILCLSATGRRPVRRP